MKALFKVPKEKVVLAEENAKRRKKRLPAPRANGNQSLPIRTKTARRLRALGLMTAPSLWRGESFFPREFVPRKEFCGNVFLGCFDACVPGPS
jgi:hypothetical protein